MTEQPLSDEERQELEAFREQARAAAAAREQGRKPPPEPTHDLLLSDGTTRPHYGAVPTHVHDGDTGRLLSVLGITERR
jgi:hypothetical protein